MREFRFGGAFTVTGYLRGQTDDDTNMIDLARTEMRPDAHKRAKGNYIFPKRSPQVEEFAKQLCNIAKVLEEDERRGTKLYRYKELGPDHYRHAMNYLEVAARKLPRRRIIP